MIFFGGDSAEYKYNGTSRLAEIDYSNLGNSGPKVRRNMHTGTVIERYAYTPYGKVTVLDSSFVLRNSSLISNEIQCAGRRLDPETGLQLNRNRFYASHLGGG